MNAIQSIFTGPSGEFNGPPTPEESFLHYLGGCRMLELKDHFISFGAQPDGENNLTWPHKRQFNDAIHALPEYQKWKHMVEEHAAYYAARGQLYQIYTDSRMKEGSGSNR